MKTADELQYWVALWRVSGVGPKNFIKLLNHLGSPEAIFSSSQSKLIQAGISEKLARNILENIPTEETNTTDIEWFDEGKDHHIITIECDEYPELLKQISDPPAILYVNGNCSLLKDPQIAIVGSRNPTQSGINNTYEFAKHLGQTGFCITSGLAMGVDGNAHNGALDTNTPTIAVTATGIDRVYPAKHRDLAHKIVKNGAIVTEFPLGTQPDARHFPRRNRIISGLSYGTLVVEAAQKSGSLITARLAMEQNREVFAIPGSIHNPLARGCHQLIRQGAKLVETAQDIMEEMSSVIDINEFSASLPTPNQATEEDISANEENTQPDPDNDNDNNPNDDQQIILKEMGFDPISIDQLVVKTGIDAASLATTLLMLELTNHVSSQGGGTYTRLK